MYILEDIKLIKQIKSEHDKCEICGREFGNNFKHAHHRIATGFGGGKRIDVRENILICDSYCHGEIHCGHIEVDKPILRDLEIKYAKDIAKYRSNYKKPVKRNVSISKKKVADNYNESKLSKAKWEEERGIKKIAKVGGGYRLKYFKNNKWVD